MRYLDFEALARMDAKAFQQQHPYPGFGEQRNRKCT